MFVWLLTFDAGMLMPRAFVSYVISLILITHFAKKKSTYQELNAIINKFILVPAVLSFFVGFYDIVKYSESIGGIQGGTPYTYAVMFNAFIGFFVSIIIFSITKALFRKKHNLSKEEVSTRKFWHKNKRAH